MDAPEGGNDGERIREERGSYKPLETSFFPRKNWFRTQNSHVCFLHALLAAGVLSLLQLTAAKALASF